MCHFPANSFFVIKLCVPFLVLESSRWGRVLVLYYFVSSSRCHELVCSLWLLQFPAMLMGRGWGQGFRTSTALKNHKNIGILSNTGPDPLAYCYQAIVQCWASETPFKWIGPFSESLKCPLYIEIWLPWQPKGNTLKSCQKLLVRFQNNLVQMVLGTPCTKIAQLILIGLKVWPPGSVACFFLCHDSCFFISEIAGPSNGDNTSCFKSLDLKPWYLVCSIN